MISGPETENDGIPREDIDRVRFEVGAVLQWHVDLGVEAEALEATGYTGAPEPNDPPKTREEQAEAMELSGEMDVEYDVPPPHLKKPARARKPRQAMPAKNDRRPRATTPRQQLARDSGAHMKPWPYGSKED